MRSRLTFARIGFLLLGSFLLTPFAAKALFAQASDQGW